MPVSSALSPLRRTSTRCLGCASRGLRFNSSTCVPPSVQHAPDIPPRLNLMPLGGSITYGVGSSDGTGYRKVLIDILHSNGYQVCMVGSRRDGAMDNNDHEGWRGYRLDQIENKARRSVPKLQSLPHVFLINAGSNDCVQDFRIDGFGKRMVSMLEYLWETSPRSTVVLSTLLVNMDEAINSRVLRVNDQIRDLARWEGKRIVLADMYSSRGPQVGHLVDGTHPGDMGYKKMASIWFDGIQQARLRGFL